LLAQVLKVRGDIPRLRETLEVGVTRFPNHAGLLSLRGSLDLEEGRFQESFAWFDSAVRADPNNSQWLYQRGRSLHAIGRVEEARRDVARADELKADTAEMSNLCLRATKDTNDTSVRCRLAGVCLRLGKPELAAYWYRAALACDPTNVEAGRGLNSLAIP
jgi:tetratricopeptide (TPR) repeat protein